MSARLNIPERWWPFLAAAATLLPFLLTAFPHLPNRDWRAYIAMALGGVVFGANACGALLFHGLCARRRIMLLAIYCATFGLWGWATAVLCIPGLAPAVLTGLILFWLTQSTLFFLVSLFALLAAISALALAHNPDFGRGILIMVGVWNTLMAPTLWIWAIRTSHTHRAFVRGACPICGYDIRALPYGVCPECGSVLEQFPVPARPPVH